MNCVLQMFIIFIYYLNIFSKQLFIFHSYYSIITWTILSDLCPDFTSTKKNSFGNLYFTRKVVFPYAWMLGFYLIYETCWIIYEKKTLYFLLFKRNIWRKPRMSKRMKANHCPFIGCTKSFIFTFFDDPFSYRSR